MTERKRLPHVMTVYGRDKVHSTPYLTRVALTQNLSLHVIHRGDEDPDPHDHDRSFLTFPLTSYVEEVYDAHSGQTWRQVVRAGRLHYRPAEYAHRIIGRWSGEWTQRFFGEPLTDGGGIVTLVIWFGKRRPAWGFWCAAAGGWRPWSRSWVHWKAYIYGEVGHG